MTTLLAILTNEGLRQGIVFADRNFGSYDDEDNLIETDITGEGEVYPYKLWGCRYNKRTTSESYCYIMADAGGATSEYLRFVKGMLGKNGRISSRKQPWEMVRRAIENYRTSNYQDTHFEEIRRLNTLVKRRTKDEDALIESLLVVNSPEFRIFYVDEFGNMYDNTKEREFEYDYLGSGSDAVKDYIAGQIEKGEIDPNKITIEAALKLGRNALKFAAKKDPGTGIIYDIGAISRKKIKFFGERTEKNFNAFVDSDIASIAEDLESMSGD